MSMISSNQARIGNEAKSVVQAAESAAAQTATSAQQQAESVAVTAVIQSQSDNTTSSGNSTSSKSTSNQTQNSSIALVAATQTTVGKIDPLKSGITTQEVISASQQYTGQIETLKSGITTQEVTSASQPYTGQVEPLKSGMTTQEATPVSQQYTWQVETLKGPTIPAVTVDTVTMLSATPTTPGYTPKSFDNTTSQQLNYGISDPSRYELFSLRGSTNIVETETPQLEVNKIGTRSPLTDAMEQRSMLLNENTQQQKTETVNKNVQPNELAGGVDIASMSTQPAGYQAYSMMMPDVAFYAPKEIYKNQKTIDNVRAFRLLSSDKLHQEMINQQYKLGN